MKTFPSLFAAQKDKNTGASPFWVLECPFPDTGPIYLTDIPVTFATWKGGVIAKPWVKNWGKIVEDISGDMALTKVSQFSLEVIIDPAASPDIETILNTPANRPESTECRLYLAFLDLLGGPESTDPPQLMWRGNISDWEQLDELVMELEMTDIGVFVDKYVGTKLDTDMFPEACPDDVGKVLPIAYGPDNMIQCLRIVWGARTTLKFDISETDNVAYITDGSKLPASGSVWIDEERISYSSITVTQAPTETTYCLNSLGRAYGSTTATIHGAGAQVWGYKPNYDSVMADHTLNAIKGIYGSINGELLQISSGVTTLVSNGRHILRASQNVAVKSITSTLQINDTLDIQDTIDVHDTTDVDDPGHNHIALASGNWYGTGSGHMVDNGNYYNSFPGADLNLRDGSDLTSLKATGTQNNMSDDTATLYVTFPTYNGPLPTAIYAVITHQTTRSISYPELPTKARVYIGATELDHSGNKVTQKVYLSTTVPGTVAVIARHPVFTSNYELSTTVFEVYLEIMTDATGTNAAGVSKTGTVAKTGGVEKTGDIALTGGIVATRMIDYFVVRADGYGSGGSVIQLPDRVVEHILRTYSGYTGDFFSNLITGDPIDGRTQGTPTGNMTEGGGLAAAFDDDETESAAESASISDTLGDTRTTGTPIGDMINGGGPLAAFDGNTSQTGANSARKVIGPVNLRTLGTNTGDMTEGGGLVAAFDGITDPGAGSPASKTLASTGQDTRTEGSPTGNMTEGGGLAAAFDDDETESAAESASISDTLGDTRTTGTPIGDMINGGGPLAAFDGNTSQTGANSARKVIGPVNLRTLGTNTGDMTEGGGLVAAFDGITDPGAGSPASKTLASTGQDTRTEGSPTGNMTEGGSLAASFDGNTSQTGAQSSGKTFPHLRTLGMVIGNLNNGGGPMANAFDGNTSQAYTSSAWNVRSGWDTTSVGTPIGDLTSFGGLAAAFDGNTSQTGAQSAQTTAVNHAVIGKDWGAGVARIISGFTIIKPTNVDICGGAGTLTVKLQGSSNGSDWVDLYATAADKAQSLYVTSGIDVSTAYRYHRVWIETPASGTQAFTVCECVLYESPGMFTGWIGKDWGAGNAHVITSFTIYPPSNAAFLQEATGTIKPDLTLQGSTNGADWVTLFSTQEITNVAGTPYSVTSGIDVSTAYRYHRITLNPHVLPAVKNYSLGLCELDWQDTPLGWANIGKDWGAGNTRKVVAFTACPSSDSGFLSLTVLVDFTFQGSNDSVSWTDLWSAVSQSKTSTLTVTSGITVAQAYRYHRLVIAPHSTPDASLTIYCAELTLYEAPFALIGKDWGAGTPAVVNQFAVYPGAGFSGSGGLIDMRLQGSDDNSVWYDLWSGNGLSNTSAVSVTSGLPLVSYRYHRIKIWRSSSWAVNDSLQVMELALMQNPFRQAGSVGKDWGAGIAKRIISFAARPSSDEGFFSLTGTIDIVLEGSSNGSSWNTLYSGTGLSRTAAINVASGIAVSVAYRYHRLRIQPSLDTGSSSYNLAVAELTLNAFRNGAIYGTVGKYWGGGTLRQVTRFALYPPSDTGFVSTGGNVEIRLEGSNDNFASGANLYTSSNHPNTEPLLVGATVMGSYSYHRFRIAPMSYPTESFVIGAAEAVIDYSVTTGLDLYYSFSLVIDSYQKLKYWLAKMAWECRCYFRFAASRVELLLRPDVLSSDKAITADMTAMDQNYRTLTRKRQSSLDEVINKIEVHYDRDSTKSGTDAYRGIYKTSDSASITRYGEKEKPELFTFDCVQNSVMAQSVANFYLARHKDRKRMAELDVFLDNVEIEFADGVTVEELGNLICEVQQANAQPGNARDMKNDRIHLIAREY